MASNQVRGTPGLLLLGFAVLMLLVAAWGWKNRMSKAELRNPPIEEIGGSKELGTPLQG